MYIPPSVIYAYKEESIANFNILFTFSMTISKRITEMYEIRNLDTKFLFESLIKRKFNKSQNDIHK